MIREIEQLIDKAVEAGRYDGRTHLIAQVVSYDRDTNLCVVQPVNKEIRLTDAQNLTYVTMPVISDVPVIQLGSEKLWLTVAPKPNTYGILHIVDRIIDDWLELGGIVEPSQIRCQNISDAIFEPSILPLAEDGDNGLMVEPINTDRISLRTRSGFTEISVLDDESVAININDGNATVTIDADGNVNIESAGTITATADSDVTVESGGDITLDNGTQSIVVGSTVDTGGATDYVAMATVTDQKIQAIADAITNAAVGTMDGGAAFKAAIIAAMTPSLAALGSVASGNLKAE